MCKNYKPAIPRVRNSEKLGKSFDKEPLVGRGYAFSDKGF
jgi:hypothetical protein